MIAPGPSSPDGIVGRWVAGALLAVVATSLIRGVPATSDQPAPPAARAESFVAPPYACDLNRWHGIQFTKAVNGRVGRPAHPFVYQDMTHPKVRALSERAGIAALAAASRSELELIRRIANWANSHWGHLRPVPYASWDALEILDRAKRGDAFWCDYKAALFVQACSAAGLTARMVGLNRKDADGHTVAEVYSNEFRKWMLVDAWWNCYYERRGIPLSAIEFHRAAGDLAGIDLVFGENGKKNEYWDFKTGKAAGLPHANRRVPVLEDPARGMIAWYHDLRIVLRNDHTVNPQRAQNRYVDGFLVPPNFRGGEWWNPILHWVDERTMPQLTALNSGDIADFEWPLNEVKVDLVKTSAAGEPLVIDAHFSTHTPDFATYALTIDGAAATPKGSAYRWKLKPGRNALVVASVNAVGRRGFPSEFVVEYDPAAVDYTARQPIGFAHGGWEPAEAGSLKPKGWSTITANALKEGEFTLDAAVKRTGTAALRATAARDPRTGTEYPLVIRSDDFRVNAATDVIFSVWLKASRDDSPVDIVLLDATYKGQGTYVERIHVGRDWRKYELKCRLHNELTSAWVGFKLYGGTIWADDAEVVEVRAAASF